MRPIAALAVAILLALVTRAAGDSQALLRALDTDDRAVLDAAVKAIEATPATPDIADVWFAAGRVCEDRLHDPARALALYERLVRELPDAGVAIAASRRIELLRDARGHAREAAAFAQLVATVDALPPAEVEKRASELAAAAWPGAPDAALFLADWLCRTAKYEAAQARYASLLASVPGDAQQATLARRNAAGCAIDGKDWDRAETLAAALTGGDEIDEAIRVDLLESVASGRLRASLYRWSWVVAFVAGVLLLASFIEAVARGGAPSASPPVEVLFVGPVALVIIAASYAIDVLIAPAVVRISVAGLLCAWISGASLDVMRRRGRDVRLRSVLHALACALVVIAVGYIAMTRDDLLELLTETVKYGPGA